MIIPPATSGASKYRTANVITSANHANIPILLPAICKERIKTLIIRLCQSCRPNIGTNKFFTQTPTANCRDVWMVMRFATSTTQTNPFVYHQTGHKKIARAVWDNVFVSVSPTDMFTVYHGAPSSCGGSNGCFAWSLNGIRASHSFGRGDANTRVCRS